MPDRYLRPGTRGGDDNGWTAEVRLDLTRTTGDAQTVSSGRYAMVTERGSWSVIEADGVTPGGYAQVEYRLTEHVTPFARLDVGGVRDEPVYRVGVSISFGGERAERPWLDPLWK